MKRSALLVAVLLATASTVLARPEDQVCDVTADYMLGRERYPEAIRLHQQVVTVHPDNALAHYHLGFAFGMIGQDQEEIREYVAAVRLGLNDWDLFLNLGLAYLGHGDIEASIHNLKDAVLHGWKHYETHFDLGIAYERAGRLSDAMQELSEALSLNRKDAEVRNMRAIVDAELGDFRSARDEWNYLLRSAPDYAPAHRNLAILAEISGAEPRASIERSHTRPAVQAFSPHIARGSVLDDPQAYASVQKAR